MFDFFKVLIRFFADNDIEYMLSGSVAMSIYTVPRATRDFDFVVKISPKDVDLFTNYFQEGYYCESESIFDAIHHQSIFNIIDFKSGFKADFIILKNEKYRQTEFQRKIQTTFLDIPIWVVSKEDLILSKLLWIQDFQSPLQMQDISQLTETHDYDEQYVAFWIQKLSLNTFNIV
jgi:hypothetical protein